jgi:hypothetical protein
MHVHAKPYLQEPTYMTFRQQGVIGVFVCGILAAAPWTVQAQSETFKATASVKTAGGASATAPVTIKIDRKMSQAEADKLGAAFKAGGVAGLKSALQGVAPTGSIQLGAGKPVPTRITIERTTDKGRLLTLVTDTPIFFLGSGLPDAKPKAGYDLGLVDIEIDAKGHGTGTLAPAAKIAAIQGAFTVQDYGAELVKLTDVAPAR